MPTIKSDLSQAEKMKVRRSEIKADGILATQEYQQKVDEAREKTERLRSIRLAREQAEEKAKLKRKPATRKKRASS